MIDSSCGLLKIDQRDQLIIKGRSVIMAYQELGEVQGRFADLIWEHEPVASGELVRLCESEFGWKKSTTYTVLKKLCEKGLFINTDGTVSALVSRSEYYGARSEQFVEETFGGSLPAFIAAFTSNRVLSAGEADEIRRMIDAFEQGKKDE